MCLLCEVIQEAERKEHLADEAPGDDFGTDAPIPDEHSGEIELPSKERRMDTCNR